MQTPKEFVKMCKVVLQCAYILYMGIKVENSNLYKTNLYYTEECHYNYSF